MGKLGQIVRRRMQSAIDNSGRWIMGVPAIVANNNDPERQHRVKVIIPSIDEEQIFDDWARQLGCYVGAPGYGSFYLPSVGSEVVLFGQLGQKYNLFYLSVFSEDFIVPQDFPNEAVTGVRVQGDHKVIAELDMQIRAGRLHIETDASISIIAPGGIFLNGTRT